VIVGIRGSGNDPQSQKNRVVRKKKEKDWPVKSMLEDHSGEKAEGTVHPSAPERRESKIPSGSFIVSKRGELIWKGKGAQGYAEKRREPGIPFF